MDRRHGGDVHDARAREDFQHVPVCRTLAVQTLVTVCAHTDDLIVVPMSVPDRQVAGEIFGGIR